MERGVSFLRSTWGSRLLRWLRAAVHYGRRTTISDDVKNNGERRKGNGKGAGKDGAITGRTRGLDGAVKGRKRGLTRGNWEGGGAVRGNKKV